MKIQMSQNIKNYYVIKSQLTKIKIHDNPFRITVYRKIRK